MSTQWKPSWTDGQIEQAAKRVETILKQDKIVKDAKSSCPKNTIWARLTQSHMERAACHNLDIHNKRIQRQKMDVYRVLRLVRNQWKTYSRKVEATHGTSKLKEIIEAAQQGPADMWLYLFFVHLQAPWKNQNPGHEASNRTAWAKIGSDNQFLWPMEKFIALR